VVKDALYLIAIYDFFVNVVLRNKLSTIAMTSACGSKLAHTRDRITRRDSWLHWRSRIKHAHNFYFYSVRF